MKLVVLAPDTPYPPNRGGRADVWRRIQAFKALGHQVFLVHLVETQGVLKPEAAHLQAMDDVVDERFSFPIKRSLARSLRQLSRLPVLPWHAATRVPDPVELAELMAQLTAFKPDLLWLEGPWFGWVAERVHERLGKPWAYRSHNIEHQYLKGQAKAATSRRNQVAWSLACVGLERYETRLMRQARLVFDISVDDMRLWRARGVSHNHWLPPLPDMAVREWPEERVTSELLFVGNLRTPNNLQGMRWLISEVLPRIRQRVPHVRLTIVGSQASPDVKDELARQDGVSPQFDVPDVAPYLLGARVLMNPVFVGSGVQLKTLDMLMTDSPIVVRSQGMRGLPDECRACVAVADDAQAFADAAVAALTTPPAPAVTDQRRALRARFTLQGIAEALALLSTPEART